MATRNISNKVSKRLQSYKSRENVELFFDMIKDILNEFNITEDDEKFCSNVRNVSTRKRISINLNSRLIAGLRSNDPNDEILFMLYLDDAEELRNSGIALLDFDTPFKNGKHLELAALYSINIKEFQNHRDEIIFSWKKCCLDYFPSQQKSQYRRYHYPEIYQLIQDETYRSSILNDIMFNQGKVDNAEVSFDKSLLDQYLIDYKKTLKKSLIPEEEYKWRVLKKLYKKWD
jgi:hypothetical protein